MPLVLKLALLTVALAGGLTDLRTRKIPNWQTLSGVVLGVGLNTFLLHGDGFRLALTGCGLALLVYLPLYLIRAMGAGDVKLMAAVGAMVGPGIWLHLFVATAILGGLGSVFLILAQGRLNLTLTNLSTITTELLHGRMPYRKDPSLDVHDDRAIGLPHGTLIAIAVVIYIAYLHA